MSEIIEPSQDVNKDPATSAWEKQITEATNNILYQIDNINESVTESKPKIAVYSLDSTGATQQYEPLAGGEGFVCYIDYTDDLPTLPIGGLVFSAFSETGQVVETIYQYRRTGLFSDNFPPHPGNVTYNAGNSAGAWSATTNWQKTIPTDDGNAVPIYVVEAKISVQGSSEVVAPWSAVRYLSLSATGEGFVYYNAALEDGNAPATPSATDYNYTTGAFTGLTNNWQITPPQVDVSDLDKKQWQSHFRAETEKGRNRATITFQSPTGYIGVGANIQSDNFDGDLTDLSNPGTAGWGIARSSGNAIFNNVAIRGKLNASDIDAGTLDCDDITVTNLDAGAISGGTLNITGLTALQGEIDAPNLNAGVLLAVYNGSGSVNKGSPPSSLSSTMISFTAPNEDYDTRATWIAHGTLLNGDGEQGNQPNNTVSISAPGSSGSVSRHGGRATGVFTAMYSSAALTKGATITATVSISGNGEGSGTGKITLLLTKVVST